MAATASNPPKAFGMRDEKDVLGVVKDPAHGVEFIRIIFPDILGRPMDFTFPSKELDKAFQEGKGFDGSSVAGFVRIEESDLVIKPDPRTFRLLPWEYRGFDEGIRWREAVMFGDILTPDGRSYVGDSRAVLKKTLAKAGREMGIEDFKCGSSNSSSFPRANSPSRPTRAAISSAAAMGRSGRRSSSSSTRWASKPSMTIMRLPTGSTKSISGTSARWRWLIPA
jgi:hypothetical protein